MAANVVIGVIGSDAGYYVLTPHGIKHVGGWNPEMMSQVQAAFAAASAATVIKDNEVQHAIASAAARSLQAPAQHIADAFTKGAGVAAASGAGAPTVVVLNIYGG